MKKFISIFFLLCFIKGVAQYNPALFTTTNKSLGVAQAVSTDARSWFYDAANFVMRDYQSANEVNTYLNQPKYRSGHFPVYIHLGGTLTSGVWLGGTTQVWWYQNGVADSNLVRWYTDSVSGGPFFAVANNLSEGNPSLIKTTLGLDNVDNTSDAQKNAATATLTNKTISGLNNTFSNIPNNALSNNSIGLTIGTSGIDIGVTTTPAQLGTSLVLQIPSAGTGSRGALTSTDWNKFNNKLDSVVVSGDSIYDCTNGTCTFRGLFSGTGGIAVLNGLNATTQSFATGTSGSDFNIISAGSTHTFNLPDASATTRGLLNSTDWSVFNAKQTQLNGTGLVRMSGTTVSYDNSVYLTNITGLITAGTGISIGGSGTSGSPYTITATGSGGLSLTTTGTSGASTLTGSVLNIPQYQGQLTLTTTGSSGAATLIGNTLNIPQYSGGGGGNTNSNIGSGFRWAVPNTNNIKTFFVVGGTLDSTTNSNALTLTIPTYQPNLTNRGSGFRLFDPTTNGIKSLTCTGCTLDSTTTGQIGITVTAGGSGTVTTVSAGNLSPLFTTSVATATTTPALTFTLSNATANSIFGNNSGSSAAPSFFVPTATTLNTWFGGTIQGALTVTTTGTSGPATLTGTTLNIPQYSGGGGSAAGPLNSVQIDSAGSFGSVPGFLATRANGFVQATLFEGKQAVYVGDTASSLIVGTVFSDNFNRASLGGNYNSNLTGTALTFPSSSYMHVVGGSTSFDSYIERVIPTGLNLHSDSVVFIPQSLTSSDFGFGFGMYSKNTTYSRGYTVQAPMSTGLAGTELFYTDDGTIHTQQYPGGAMIGMSVGDTLVATATRTDSTVIFTLRNRATNDVFTHTYLYPATVTTGSTQLSNTGYYRMYFFGGTFDILNWTVFSPEHQHGIVWVGNSIEAGYAATNWDERYLNLLYPLNRAIFDAQGGPGDKSADGLVGVPSLLSHNPKTVVIALGVNDRGTGVPTSTYSTNIDSLIRVSIAAGATPYLLGNAPQNSGDITPYNDTLIALAGRYHIQYIDIFDTLANGTNYADQFTVDGVHPNSAGHAAIAAQIRLQAPSLLVNPQLRMDNAQSLLNDPNARIALWSPTAGFGAGILLRDTTPYVKLSPTSQQVGFINVQSIQNGVTPDGNLPNWFVNNKQNYVNFGLQNISDIGYSGFALYQANNNLGATIAWNNGGITGLGVNGPNNFNIRTRMAGSGIGLTGGDGGNRATSDFEVDSGLIVNRSAATFQTLATFAAATTSTPSILLTSSGGVNPTTPSSGMLWWNGTNLYFNNGSGNVDLLAGGGGGISLTTTGTSGASTLTGTTLNIPQYQGALTLTTSGTSGAATLSGNTLNIPQYSGGGGSQNLESVLTTGATLTNPHTITNTSQILSFTGGLYKFNGFSADTTNTAYIIGKKKDSSLYEIPLSQFSSLLGSDTLFANGSLQLSGDTISLIGDNVSPGNSMYYGTNASGVKGFFALTGGGTNIYTSDGTISSSNRTVTIPSNGSLTFLGSGADNININAAPSGTITLEGNAINLQSGNTGAVVVTGGVALGQTDITTSGSGIVVAINFSNYAIDPASVIPTYTITLPSTLPDGFIANFFFGGTITSGTVITTLSVGTSGATIVQNSAPTTASAGDYISYKFFTNGTIKRWYRVH